MLHKKSLFTKVVVAFAALSFVGLASVHAALISTDFDNNDVPDSSGSYEKDTSGASTAGVTWTEDPTVTSISDLTAITGGGGFDNRGVDYSNDNSLYVNYNLNNGTDQGYSFDFTIDSSVDLSSLEVLAGHSNDQATMDQNQQSDTNFSLSGGTLGEAVTGLSREDHDSGPAYHTVTFDLTGTTLGAGTYTTDVFMDNLSGGGAYAIYNGITLEGNVIPEPSTFLLGLFGVGILFFRRRRRRMSDL